MDLLGLEMTHFESSLRFLQLGDEVFVLLLHPVEVLHHALQQVVVASQLFHLNQIVIAIKAHMDLQEFRSLKEEAKQLLLKGCYKMSLSKYRSLTVNPPPNLSPRELSTLYLNQGICLQFLEKKEQSLSLIESAITVDPTYDKPYFRRLQVCRDMKRYKQALAIPPLLKNKEITELMEAVKVEYLLELSKAEWQVVERAFESAIKDNNPELVTGIHQNLVQKYQQSETLQKDIASGVFNSYLQILKDNKAYKYMGMFFETVNVLLARRKDVGMGNIWWQENLEWLLDSRVYPSLCKLMKHCPYFELAPATKLSIYLKQPLSLATIDSLSSLLVVVGKVPLSNTSSQTRHEVEQLINIASQNLLRNLSEERIDTSEILWSVLSCLFDTPYSKRSEHVPFLQLCERRFEVEQRCREEGAQVLEVNTEEFEKLTGLSQLTGLLQQEHSRNAFLYLLNEILMRVKCNTVSEETQHLLSLPTNHQLSPFTHILSTLVTMKLSFKDLSKQQIEYTLTLKPPTIDSSLYLQFVGTLCILEPQYILRMLDSDILQLSYAHGGASISRVNLRSSLVSLIYLLLVDTSEDKNQEAARKLGVTVEEVKAARKLQSSRQSFHIEEEIQAKRKGFVVKNLHPLCTLLQGISSETNSNLTNHKISCILSSLSKPHPKSFYSSSFIDLMIQQHKHPLSQDNTFRFFSSICKECNPSIFLFRHKQNIVDILIDSLSKAQHQLIIFQSLLSIIILLQDTSIDINQVCALLLDQNEYILHATLNVLNNYLVKGKLCYDKMLHKHVETVMVYYRHYKLKKEQQPQPPLTDYSNPQQLYTTLVSLLMILSDYTTIEAPELKSLEFLIDATQSMDIRERAKVVGKGILYFADRGSLKKKTLGTLREELQHIRLTDQQRHSQILPLLA